MIEINYEFFILIPLTNRSINIKHYLISSTKYCIIRILAFKIDCTYFIVCKRKQQAYLTTHVKHDCTTFPNA